MEVAGITHKVAPIMTQDQIDGQQPPATDRQRYRLTRPGQLAIGATTVLGPQMGGAVPSQLVWLSAASADGFGDLVEIVP